ncbi:transcriptional regulator [Streptococcus criceti]|uniref:HTH tetR-type domain-containing protein n=1 Tax=Streptococcus criceti HS-6 TaxID=873449 RepID=G5JTJ6_STRCG|nr:TetR/AcrR family transcriptional regulator [Streptococcus criceti]EHI74386.1 hypothetical protein STRCR_1093 [Streptococcus criceti HS-6]SUN37668.1 transcriptional regulator [Streptococcus criceti]
MKRNTAQLKENLIQTGIEEIRQHGIDNLSLRTVSQKCGVTHGAPYKHFGSKDGYLRIVLSRLSDFWANEMTVNIAPSSSARDELTQMGFNFVLAAKRNPYVFEALFVKYPFKYLELSGETILTETDLPGFDAFKHIVLKLRQQEGFNNSEAETLFHFWSFISGLAILSQNPIGTDLSQSDIRTTIEHMLDIYIKGENT